MTTNENKLDAVKKEIRSVLISSKNGLSLKEFSNEYKSLLGKTLPFKEFGYNTYIDFLQDLTDVVHVQVEKGGSFQLYGIADDATQHIQKLVSRQRSNPKKKTEKVTRLNRNISQTNEPRGKPFVPALLRGELLLLLKNHPNGIGYSSLVTEYRKIFGKEISLGWLSQDQNEKFRKLAEAVPEIELKTFYGQLKLFHKDVHKNHVKPVPRSASNSLSQQKNERLSNCYADKSIKVDEKYLYSSAIPESIKRNFEKVLKLYPEGILAVHFPIAYEMITKESLDIFALSYTSLLEIADALPDIFYYYKNPAKNNEWIFRHADFCNKASTPTNSISNGHAHKSVPQKFQSSNNFKEDLDIGNHYLPYNIEELPSDGFRNFFPVFISAVDSPGCFWIHIQNEDSYNEFSKLEKEMNDFYDDRSYKYKMKDAHIIVGASCVVFSKSDDHWYRAEILSIPSIKYVNVTYVDYGSSENIEKYNLYYLKNEFKSFPRYAHKATLAGVVPANQKQKWDEKAKDVFLRLTSQITMAKIYSKDEDILSLILCDTEKGKSIFINDTLEQEGFAEIDPTYEICYGSKDLSTDLQSEEVYSSNHFSRNQINGKITSEEAPLRNGIKMPNGHVNRSLIRQPALEESNKRYVKRVCLDEGYRIHLIVVDDKAYVSGGDLCSLFWADKPADVLALKLKFKGVSVPTISVSEEDNSKLFHQCKRYSVKSFLDAVSGSTVELYPLDCVMKVLNTFGHPSAQIRETLVQEISNFDLQSTFWKEYQDPEEDNLDKSFVDKNTWSNLCHYDLTALHTGLEYQRLKLMNESNGNIYNSAEIKKIESKQNNIKKRMDEILLICSQYAS